MRDRAVAYVAAGARRPAYDQSPSTTQRRHSGDKTPGVQKHGGLAALGKDREPHSSPSTLGFLLRDTIFTARRRACICRRAGTPDQDHCREQAGIPDSVVYRPWRQIGLEPHQRAGGIMDLSSEWITFDEGYCSKPEFLRELSNRNQKYTGEVLTWLCRLPGPSGGKRIVATVVMQARGVVARYCLFLCDRSPTRGSTNCSATSGSAIRGLRDSTSKTVEKGPMKAECWAP